MFVRQERDDDAEAVRQVVAGAFADPAAPGQLPIEVTLLAALRVDDGWLPALSLVVSAPDGELVRRVRNSLPSGTRAHLRPQPASEVTDLRRNPLVGHVVCTRGDIDGTPALGLGPLAVRPDCQRQGVGSALMHAVLGAADALGETVVCLLGSPAYYRRFGFRAAAAAGIAAPDPAWGEHFQFRPLSGYRPVSGAFSYAGPFNQL